MSEILNTKGHTDIKRLTVVEEILPPHLRPYLYLLRLDRPVGIWLLLLPALWSIALASGGIYGFSYHTFITLILFAIGAVIMRGAGCVINDLWDRDLDKLVERTKNRPIASGVISVKQGIIFLATLLLIGLTILLQFNPATLILGFATIPLIATYPLMKRITWWPQAFLGLTFNFSALMGWSAITGSVGMPALLLYLGGICWTIAYDTIYAHQDKEDDIMAGIKSTARIFDKNSKKYVAGFFIAALILFTSALVLAKGFTLYHTLIALPILHFGWQMLIWQPDIAPSSLKVFKSNRNFGLLILLCCLL